MPQEQQIPLETSEFSVPTGAPASATQKIVARKPLEISDVKTFKGKWLHDKLSSLYSDPKYKSASPEQQKAYKELAYTKWIQPYFTKVLKTTAPTKDDWLTGSTHYFEGTPGKETKPQHLDQELGTHVEKVILRTSSGLLHDLSYVGRALDSIVGDDDRKPGEQNLEQIFTTASKYYGDAATQVEGELKVLHGNKNEIPFSKDVPGRLAEFGTQGVIFEVAGGAKASKVLNVANPKTASLALQMAKASWNGAVDFAGWSASQGETPQEISKSAAVGAVGGAVLKSAQRTGLDPLFDMLKNSFKWGGKTATQQVVNEAITKALTKSEGVSPLNEQSRKASTIAASELEKYSQEKFKRSFKDLGYIQKAHVLNKFLAVTKDAVSTAQREGMPKQLVQAQAKEQDDLMTQIFPEAKASQQKIEEFVKQSGLEPQSTKMLATLPHHNTTIDSPIRHISGRISFLQNQLRTAKASEKEGIQQALQEEYSLLKQKKQSTKGTVGGAAAGDPRAFHGEQYVVSPYIDPYNTGFGDWRGDSFAQGVAQLARQQAAAKGSARSFMTDAIDNSFMVGSNLSKKAFLQEGTTKQLLHDQFGVVGGINYSMERAYNLGERSGFHPNDSILFINWLAMRPNVVARVWNVPGGGQTLFLHAAQEAERTGAGIALIPYDASRSFYEKMGMHDVGSYMAMTHSEVQTLLKNKGLLMMLLGAGISYGASKELSQGDYSVKGSN